MEKLLDRIDSPEQLRTLTVEQLTQLAGELREFIIQTVSKTGGHLAPSSWTKSFGMSAIRLMHIKS